MIQGSSESSYVNQLKKKVIPEYGQNFSFIKQFVEFLGGSRDNSSFQEMQSVPTMQTLGRAFQLLWHTEGDEKSSLTKKTAFLFPYWSKFEDRNLGMSRNSNIIFTLKCQQ